MMFMRHTSMRNKVTRTLFTLVLFFAAVVFADDTPAVSRGAGTSTPLATAGPGPAVVTPPLDDSASSVPAPVSSMPPGSSLDRMSLPLEMTTEVDRSTMKLGDIFTYVLTIRYDPSLIISLPGWGANLGQFEIRDYNSSEKKEADGRKSSRAEYHLAVYDTGEFTIPPVAVVWKTAPDANEEVLWSDSVTISVESIADSDASDVRGLKTQATVPPDYSKLTIVVGSVIAGIILVAVVIFLLVRHSRRGYPQPEKPAGPPHVVALAELEALLASPLRAEGRLKEFYYELSEIIRRYLGRRFQIYTLERTTEEILEQVQLLFLESGTLNMIAAFLQNTDLVKFASYTPAETECDECISTGRQIISVTKQDFASVDPSKPGSGVDGYQTTLSTDQPVSTDDISAQRTEGAGPGPDIPTTSGEKYVDQSKQREERG